MPESVFDYWNKQPNLRTHKKDSKIYKDSIKYLTYLIDGTFGNRYSLSEQCVEINNISGEELTRPWTQEEINNAVDKYNYMCGSDYSADRQFFPKTLSDFIYNPRTENSFIFSLLGEDRIPLGMKPKILNNAVYEFYKNEYFSCKTISETEDLALIKISNFLWKQQEKWQNSIGKYFHDHRLKGLGFIRTHKNYINREYRDRDNFNISYLGQMTWQSYCIHLKKELNIDIIPSQKQIHAARERYDEEEKIMKEREEKFKIRSEHRTKWLLGVRNEHPAARFVSMAGT